MRQVVDIKGRRFGKLVAQNLAGINKKGALWNCECDCGNSIIVPSRYLLHSGKSSCGCDKVIDITGETFGRLTAISKAETIKNKARWLCKCTCGNEKIVDSYKLRHGETRSCGCIVREGIRERVPEERKRLKRIWRYMIKRCYEPLTPSYKYYGERGIYVCDEWRNDFEVFYSWAMENGYANDLTIDRIDVNKSYTPDNCRWATMIVQQRNRRNNVLLTIGNETHAMSEWADISKTKAATIWYRKNAGWNDEESVFGKRI